MAPQFIDLTPLTRPALILLALTFVFLAFLLNRQIELLNSFLKTPLGAWIKLASILYLGTTIVMLFWVWMAF